MGTGALRFPFLIVRKGKGCRMAEQKTNAMRMLDRAKVPYQTHTYDHADGKIDGVSRRSSRLHGHRLSLIHI